MIQCVQNNYLLPWWMILWILIMNNNHMFMALWSHSQYPSLPKSISLGCAKFLMYLKSLYLIPQVIIILRFRYYCACICKWVNWDTNNLSNLIKFIFSVNGRSSTQILVSLIAKVKYFYLYAILPHLIPTTTMWDREVIISLTL